MKGCIEFLENQKRYDLPPPNRLNKKIDEIINQLQEIENMNEFKEKYFTEQIQKRTTIKLLEDIKDKFVNYKSEGKPMREEDAINIGIFMTHCITLFKEQTKEIEKLKGGKIDK